ncbi:class I adenylate-forming enzyme family protein [Brevibacterium sp. FAM 24638]|uniref:class I adenylate-forming enzyme family protein n=1 Tax=Brevibacterium sp. FAM 24638 TaxID=3415681 RepID=UPI003C7E206C
MATLPFSLRCTAARFPDKEAVLGGNFSLTYSELDAEVDRTAHALSAHGLVHGDRVALMLGNSERFIVTLYAALRIGAIVLPVNPASAPPEIEYLLEDSGARVFVYDPALAAAVTPVLGSPPLSLKTALSLGEHICEAAVGQGDLLAESARFEAIPWETTAEAQDVQEDDDALILYTSGTTGKPKGALFDHHRVMWTGMNSALISGMREFDVCLHVAPLYHAAQLCIMLLPGVHIGIRHVVMSSFDPVEAIKVMEREKVSIFFGVPTMYQFMLRTSLLSTADLGAWRTGMFGAAPMSATVVERLSQALPDVELMQLCGQTEAGPGGIYCNGEQVKERPDSSGRQALPLTEVRVVDPNGDKAEPGTVGELVLRGETVMKKYWGKPKATSEAIRDGWLHTGDLARLDADGYMTVVDRMKDLIITGGRNVYSVEVENALLAHPQIVEAAVVGRPHEDYGESIIAIVTTTEGSSLDSETIRDHCREHVATYKVPHEVRISTDIPRNPSGKILKHQLRTAVSE